METGERDTTRRRTTRKRRIRAEQPKLDPADDKLGGEFVDPSVLVRPETRSPEDAFALNIIGKPHLHRRWIALPLGDIGRVKATATRNHWQKPRRIDGRLTRFDAAIFPRDVNGKPYTGVAVRYDPDRQPDAAAPAPAGTPTDADERVTEDQQSYSQPTAFVGYN